MTGSPHANHRSARSPRRTPEEHARDNPIAGPQTGTTRSAPSVPASVGVSGRHNEPGSRPACACPAQPPSKAGGEGPRGGEKHPGVGKADWSTESNQTRRGAAHHAGPRGTPERHATGHNHGTGRGAQKKRPLGAANPDSARHPRNLMAPEAEPSNTQTDEGRPPRRPPAARGARGTEGKQRRRDPQEAEKHKRSGDEGKACPGDKTPRRGSSGGDQAAGAAAPWTGTSRDKWRAGTHERSNQGGTRRRSRRHPGLDNPGTSGRGRPGLEHPGRSKQQEPPPPGLVHPGARGRRRPGSDHPGQNKKERPQPRGTQTAREKWPAAQGKIVQGGSSRRSPRPLDRSGSNTKDQDHARGEHRSRAEEEAGEKQRSRDVAGPRGSGEAVQRERPRGCGEAEMRTRPRRRRETKTWKRPKEKQRSTPEDEGGGKRRSGHRDEAKEKPRGSQEEGPDEKQ